jgi:VIT family
MALGEWLSVTNAQEFARSQIDQEKEELEQTPDAERKGLALIFQAKGLPREDAQRVATDLMRQARRAGYLGPGRARHRSHRVGRQPVECRRILVRLVRRHDRNSMELGGECRRLGSDRPRPRHFAFQRPRACVLGDTAGLGRSGRRRRHLRHGGTDRRVAILSALAAVIASAPQYPSQNEISNRS